MEEEAGRGSPARGPGQRRSLLVMGQNLHRDSEDLVSLEPQPPQDRDRCRRDSSGPERLNGIAKATQKGRAQREKERLNEGERVSYRNRHTN